MQRDAEGRAVAAALQAVGRHDAALEHGGERQAVGQHRVGAQHAVAAAWRPAPPESGRSRCSSTRIMYSASTISAGVFMVLVR